jgi:hypothetical protein
MIYWFCIFTLLEKGPEYALRKEWRYILRRLRDFLRMIDYLVQEMLQRIVKVSVKHLHDYVKASAEFDEVAFEEKKYWIKICLAQKNNI